MGNDQKQQPQQQMNLNIQLENTTAIKNSEGGTVFHQGVILRKASKFMMGSEEDGLIPLAVFYDPSTGKILKETIPVELREEYKDEII